MINAPCKDCPNKGCGAFHDQCEAYQQFKKECEAAKEAEQLAKMRNDLLVIPPLLTVKRYRRAEKYFSHKEGRS